MCREGEAPAEREPEDSACKQLGRKLALPTGFVKYIIPNEFDAFVLRCKKLSNPEKMKGRGIIDILPEEKGDEGAVSREIENAAETGKTDVTSTLPHLSRIPLHILNPV